MLLSVYLLPATIYFYLVLFQPQHTVAFALMLATIYCKKTTAIEMSTYCRLLAANCSRNVSYLSKVLGKLGPGQLGPGQLGPGQLGPGQLGP